MYILSFLQAHSDMEEAGWRDDNCQERGEQDERWLLDSLSPSQLGCLTHWLLTSLTAWQLDCLTTWLHDYWTVWLFDSLTFWLIDRLTAWQFDSLIAWHLTVCLWRLDGSMAWQPDCLTFWLSDSFTIRNKKVFLSRQVMVRNIPTADWFLAALCAADAFNPENAKTSENRDDPRQNPEWGGNLCR